MVKRETDKETEEDLKQVFRVFDKVKVFTSMTLIKNINYLSIRMGMATYLHLKLNLCWTD